MSKLRAERHKGLLKLGYHLAPGRQCAGPPSLHGSRRSSSLESNWLFYNATGFQGKQNDIKTCIFRTHGSVGLKAAGEAEGSAVGQKGTHSKGAVE